MTNLQARILIALLYFPALLLSVFDETAFALVVSLLLATSWYEYLQFHKDPNSPRDALSEWLIIFLGTLPALVQAVGRSPTLGFAAILLALQIHIIRGMFRRKTFEDILTELKPLAFGFVYLTVLFCCLLGVRTHPGGREAIWFLLFVIGASDSLAYFFGRAWGRKPFFQHLSPKKTVEGFWGGMLGSMACGLGFYYLFGWLEYHVPSLVECLLLSLVIGISGVFGDLFESMLKRRFHVKDSGVLLGAHGGILDRFDAVIFAAVPLYFYMVFRGGFQ